jgi:hypothetical protein
MKNMNSRILPVAVAVALAASNSSCSGQSREVRSEDLHLTPQGAYAQQYGHAILTSGIIPKPDAVAPITLSGNRKETRGHQIFSGVQGLYFDQVGHFGHSDTLQEAQRDAAVGCGALFHANTTAGQSTPKSLEGVPAAYRDAITLTETAAGTDAMDSAETSFRTLGELCIDGLRKLAKTLPQGATVSLPAPSPAVTPTPTGN